MAKTVWIVDDDSGILDVVSLVLQQYYQIKTFTNESSLMNAMQTDKPNLLLLDILLSGSDGCDIAKRLKEDETYKSIPIIIMSANNNLEDKCKNAPVEGILKKPFDIDELERLVKKLLSKS